MSKTVMCPAEAVFQLIAGRWKLMVIYWLLQGEQRFNELQRRLGRITHRTLARQLREMEADGLVERRDYGEIPPRVDYRLTPLGRSLQPILQAMEEWATPRRLAPLPRSEGEEPGSARPQDQSDMADL